MSTTHTFHVQGMHCNSCPLYIEETFTELSHVDTASASLEVRQVTVTGTFTGSPEEVATELTGYIRAQGYALSVEKKDEQANWHDLVRALPIAAFFIAGFLLLQKAGITNLISTGTVGYGTAFAIGLVASISTCLAVVGGLVLSLGASSAKEGGTWRTQTLFHVGRIGGFFILGGLIGAVGSTFQLSLNASMILSGLVALVMLILGLNLLDVFHGTKRFQPTMPKLFARGVLQVSKHDHYLAPFLVGVGTFFLPCGFTQSMQLYALTTGSFLSGALTMLVFALGTFPMLALLSFGSVNIAHKPWKGVFFKTAGLVVIALALFNIANVLATAGIINPLFNL